MSARSLKVIFSAAVLIATMLGPVAFHSYVGGVEAWTDGNDDSPVRPNYGLQDMIAHKALKLLEERNDSKALFLTYWFDPLGADDESDSYNENNLLPRENDNFLAWTDDGPEGVTVEYYINNPEPGQDPQTNAVKYAQLLANRSVENLTQWLLEGGGTENSDEIRLMHAAAYNAGKLAKYVGDMSQYGHTDYSKWDQLSEVPRYHPSEVDYPYREYYEARLWNDANMQMLYDTFWNETFDPEGAIEWDSVHTATSDLAKWVNGRGQPPVQMEDYDGETITVGHNYKIMLENFMYCWDYDFTHKGVRGFNGTLWNLTLENLVAAAENLTSMYEGLFDRARDRYLEIAPELNLVDWAPYPDPVIAGDMVSINATIKNDGNSATKETFRVELSAPDGNKWRGLTLEAGEQKNITFAPFPIGEDPVDITMTIDYQENVAESDESNNIINGTVVPIPEVHSCSLSLAAPFPSIRRDTQKTIQLRLSNTGNRADIYSIEAESDTDGLEVIVPSTEYLVKPKTSTIFNIILINSNDTELGTSIIDITSTGVNSSANFDLSLDVLERTTDPIPIITGFGWARSGEEITLSASESTDPDGDDLSFKWIIPMMRNSTEEEITFNYTKLGTYEIELQVNDGNTTSTLVWPLIIYPNPPENISAEVVSRGVSGISVSWRQWPSGGLIAYWLEAIALPGQGELSDRGPYIERIGPGNSTGRVGKFLPGTEVEIKVTVQAERYGNVTMDTLTTSTSSTTAFENTLKLSVEDYHLVLQYKPWVDLEGERDPEIRVERLYAGDFIPIETSFEYIQRTDVRDTLRYTLGSNSGTYRAYLTYYWANESISPFSFFEETQKPNMAPDLNLTGTDQEYRLNINGTCRVWLELGILDPEDTMDIEVQWGDGNSEEMDYDVTSDSREFLSLFHNYSEIDSFSISIMVEDWNGAVTYYNDTIQVQEYKETEAGEEEERSVWTLVLLILLGIFLVIILVALGFVAYKISKKDTEVEFKMKDFKSDLPHEKVGTGTDFDQRRKMQIPQESIMGPGKEEKKSESSVSGTITFDDEE